MKLKEIKKELLIQNNLGTSNPYWVIRDYKKIPSNSDYTDKYIWVSDGSEFTNEEIMKYFEEQKIVFDSEIDSFDFETQAKEHEFEKMYYIEVEQDEEVFLTHKSAKNYFKSRRYNFSVKAHLYCKSAYYSNELKFLQKGIKKGSIIEYGS